MLAIIARFILISLVAVLAAGCGGGMLTVGGGVGYGSGYYSPYYPAVPYYGTPLWAPRCLPGWLCNP